MTTNKNDKDMRPLPSNLLGPRQNDREVVIMLNKFTNVSKRRQVLNIILEFTERITALLYLPPTQRRMKHALHFVDLEYKWTIAKLRQHFTDEVLYMRVLGVIRARRASVNYRLINSMKMLSYKDLLSQLPDISDSDILAVYPYGSRVYGSSRAMSDYDFIIITKNLTQDTLTLNNHIHATMYSYKDYINRLDDHEISILECMSLPREMMVKAIVHPQLDFIDVEKLRVSISTKSSNSLVKAKKKITLYDDRESKYIGLKSLFHSLRMIRFAIQLARFGKIVDFGECNELYDQMLNEPLDWDYLLEKYKPIHNAWCTEFRVLSPKPQK